LAARSLAAPAPVFEVARPWLDEAALDRWIADYTEWREWSAKWGTRRQWVAYPFPYPFWKENPDIFSYVVPRRSEPDPPAGLEAACVEWPRSATSRDRRARACELLTFWKDDYPTQQIRSAVATARAQQDDVSRSRFIEHIHFASLWTSLQGFGDHGAYGLAGVHATIDVHGRWQIYALPGIMAVSVPNTRGRRTVTIGYDWGMAVRLGALRVPVAGLPLKVHLNLAHVWMPEVNQRLDMIGLSFSANRGR
jgi:hypothetical protein